MRNIKDLLNESANNSIPVNIILNGSGSMHGDKEMKDAINAVLKQFTHANLFVYNTSDDEVVELNGMNEFKPAGPHNNKLKGLDKFFMDHIGQTNIFMTN